MRKALGGSVLAATLLTVAASCTVPTGPPPATTSSTTTTAPPRGVPYDFDGDGRADLVTIKGWGLANPPWYRLGDVNPLFVPAYSTAVPGDYDGDGKWEPASVDWSTGEWQTTGGRGTFTYPPPPVTGSPGLNNAPLKYPVLGDYDGDGTTDPAWYREEDATWWIEGSASPIQFGQPRPLDKYDQDIAVPADYDGDGRTDLAVYRTATATFTVQGHVPVTVGVPYSFPAPGDYDGDGDDDPAAMFWGAVYPTTQPAGFFILGQPAVPLSSDIPVPANYDGAPGDEVAVSNGPSGGYGRTDFEDGSSVTFDNIPDAYPVQLRPYLIVNILRLTAHYRCVHSNYQPPAAAC